MGVNDLLKMSSNYNLRWDGFLKHFQKSFSDLMTSNLYTDVTLVCDDKIHLNAHKVVLASCSEVLKNVINEFPQGTNSFIYLRGIKSEEMKSLLEIMYVGETRIKQIRLQEIYNVAKNLEIKEILSQIESTEENTNFEQDSIGKEELIKDTEDCIDDFSLLNEILQESSEEEKKDDVVESMYEKNKQDKVVHEEEPIFLDCKICDYKTTLKCKLKVHMRKHEQKLSCSQCKRQCSTEEKLKVHIAVVHNGTKYACNKCDYNCIREKNIKKHIQTKH